MVIWRQEKPVPQHTRFRRALRSDTDGHNSSVARTKEDGHSRACNRKSDNNSITINQAMMITVMHSRVDKKMREAGAVDVCEAQSVKELNDFFRC